MVATTWVTWLLGAGIDLGAFAAAFLLFRYVARSIRRGVVAYGGNTMSTLADRRYSRRTMPGFFWFGIVLYTGFAIGATFFAVRLLVAMIARAT